jgi:hypothetical protein
MLIVNEVLGLRIMFWRISDIHWQLIKSRSFVYCKAMVLAMAYQEESYSPMCNHVLVSAVVRRKKK